MAALSIGEVARRTGVQTSALRYYERAGVLPKAGRLNGRRVYDGDTVRRVDLLRFAQQAGFTLDEIKMLFHGLSSGAPLSVRWQKLARQKLLELDAQLQRVQQMKKALEVSLKCGCLRIEDCTLSPADAFAATAKPRGGCSC